MVMRRLVRSAAFAAACSWLGCATAPPPPPTAATPAVLEGTDGRPHSVPSPEGALTILEFFSATCPCQAAHDQRLRSIAADYAGRGVAILAVDSEVDAKVERDRAEAARRGYPFPVVVDPGGVIARAYQAEFATYIVLMNRAGDVLYRGGIDSDKRHLHPDATSFLRDALDDALAGRPLRRPEGRTLGCALMLP
jgi:peroxiredoxin